MKPTDQVAKSLKQGNPTPVDDPTQSTAVGEAAESAGRSQLVAGSGLPAWQERALKGLRIPTGGSGRRLTLTPTLLDLLPSTDADGDQPQYRIEDGYLGQAALQALALQLQARTHLVRSGAAKSEPQMTAARTPIAYPDDAPAIGFQDVPWTVAGPMNPVAFGAMLAVGSTGTGKTTSVVRPALVAVLRYQIDGLTSAGLLIDPKAELLADVERELTRQQRLPALRIVGRDVRLRALDGAEALSVRDQHGRLRSLLGLDDLSPSGESHQWQLKADNFQIGLLEADRAFHLATGVPLFELALGFLTQSDAMPLGQWASLVGLYQYGLRGDDERWVLSAVLDVLLCLAGVDPGLNSVRRYAAPGSYGEGANQFLYMTRTAMQLAEPAASPELAQALDLSLRPNDPRNPSVSMRQGLDDGQIFVYQPGVGESHDAIGRTVKSLFIDALMQRRLMQRPIFYVCDEFQRFYTSSPKTGEHAFLDVCRAYRVTCVLATQSIAALNAAIGQDQARREKVAALLANIRTSVWFRSTDPETIHPHAERLRPPPRPDVRPLSIVRPLAALPVGTCYVLTTRGDSIYRCPWPRPAEATEPAQDPNTSKAA